MILPLASSGLLQDKAMLVESVVSEWVGAVEWSAIIIIIIT